MKIERCCECDEATGRAGRGEDSLYDPADSGKGPYCQDCFDKLLSEASRLRAWEDNDTRHYRDQEEYERAKECARKYG